MVLQKLIESKSAQLNQSQFYKDVRFLKAYDIKLKRYGSSEDSISVDSDLTREVEEVEINHSTLSMKEYQSGTRIVFEILGKRKRNYTTISFYAIFK